MINDQLSYRVFIEKSELLRLRKIEKLYNEGSTAKKENANFTIGHGNTFPVDPQPCSSNTDTNDQRDGENPMIKKEIIIPGASYAPKTSETKEQDTGELSPSAVLAPIWKRYQNKASKLLTEIRLNPTIHYNSKGEVSIDGTLYEKSDIRELLSACFYTKNNKQIEAIGPFIAFLKDNSLYQSVKNPKLIISESKYPWYYLGMMIILRGGTIEQLTFVLSEVRAALAVTNPGLGSRQPHTEQL